MTGDKPLRETWCLVTTFWCMLCTLGAAALLIFVVLKKPLWIEIELLAFTFGLMISVFYSTVLYRGVRLVERKAFFGAVDLSRSESADCNSCWGWPGSLLIELFLDIVLLLLVEFGLFGMLWLGVNILLASLLGVLFPAYCLFQRSAQFVASHQGFCKGKLRTSLFYGVGYALLKTMSLCAIVCAAHFIELI